MNTPSRIFAVSMRMSVAPETGELRNAIADDWTTCLARVAPDAIWLPLPNVGKKIAGWLAALKPHGIILSGGDDWGVFPARDETELALCRFALDNGVPLLGVCRGMQVLNHALGGKLPSRRDRGHVAARHDVTLHQASGQSVTEVNSYHSGLLFEEDLASGLTVTARAADGSVEAFRVKNSPMYGIMWHPERERETRPHDREIFALLFGNEK